MSNTPLTDTIVTALEEDLADPASRFRDEVGRVTDSLAAELETDPAMQEWANRWLVELAVTTVDDNRLAIASLISDTVRSWDAVETSRRIEGAIGRDLQFIRINGTLVGGLVGAALVGTFLGILLAYGLVGPIGKNLEAYANAEAKYYECIKQGLLAYLNGYAPQISVEFARKTLFSHVRPTFQELEEAMENIPAPGGG